MDNNQNNAANAMSATDNQQGTAWQLVGLSPALTDLTIDIDKSLSIGRSDSNDLVLATSQISRQHAKINRVGEKMYVQDLGSSNGTFVNGERITTEAYALQATDELAFADLLFLVVKHQTDRFEDDNFLNSLQDIQNFAQSTDPHAPTNQVAPIEQPTSLAAPVIDVFTTQDFVANAQPANTHDEQVLESTQPKPAEVANANQQTANITPTTSTTSTTSTTKPVVTEAITAKSADIHTTMPPIQHAQTSPVSTVGLENMKPVAKKNALLAIMIVVIIALVILATLFMY